MLDPLGLMVQASRQAADMAGDRAVLKKLDGVMVVRILSRDYASAAA
ncbi:MAG: hypothetical protein JSW39_14680 [Desulfobacterales bacterium]|nr:MAG: hypothetical protein JSW39_14680 [Desulfobacterales bacterium]